MSLILFLNNIFLCDYELLEFKTSKLFYVNHKIMNGISSRSKIIFGICDLHLEFYSNHLSLRNYRKVFAKSRYFSSGWQCGNPQYIHLDIQKNIEKRIHHSKHMK